MIEGITSFEFHNPVAFWLIIPLGIGLLGGAGAYFIKKACPPDTFLYMGVREYANLSWSRWRHNIPVLIRFFGLLLLVLALADVTRSYVTSVERVKKQRIIKALDVSGSMWDWPKQPPYSSINCNRNDRQFKRIYGACRALHRMVDEAESASKSADSGNEHLISILVFAYRSAVVSYPTNNYAGLRKKIDLIEFYTYGPSSHGLGLGTAINGVIWNMYLMALDRNFKNEPGFVFLSENDKEWIARALNPASADSPSILSDELRNKLMRIREELRDTVFIVFTDAVVQYLTIQMYSEQHGFPFSIERELKLAELLELPVFFISTDEFYPELKELARRTGYGSVDAGTRGDFLVAKPEGDFINLQDLMSVILKYRFALTTPIEVVYRESYAEVLVMLALTLIATSVIWKKTFPGSLTEFE